jgi:polyphosphate kinase
MSYETPKLKKKKYEKELHRLQVDLVQMVDWVKREGARVAVVFEGRDAAGKGGVIKRITEYVSPRVVRTVALPTPTEKETTQWYFQRYIEHLPAAGEVVLFDRSWYNRAGVEKVLGFCSPEEHKRFLNQCPTFERMLVEDGIILIKYWFSVSEEEQERRFEARIDDPLKQWKLSGTDLESRTRWVDYSRAKDEMFVHCDIPECRWHVVDSTIKRNARINCISHLLGEIPWEPRKVKKVKMPPKQDGSGYERPPEELQSFVPDRAAKL